MKRHYTFKKHAHHFNRICFPDGNKKQDKCVSISLAPEHTCPKDAPCKTSGACYYLREGNYMPTVAKSAANNWARYVENPAAFWAACDKALEYAHNNGYPFRWFEGGDCPSYEFFCEIMKRCRKYPGMCHGMTKQYAIVNRYIAEHGGNKSCVLDYYNLRFSRWQGYPMDNPFLMPEFAVTNREEETTCVEQRLKMLGKPWSCYDCYQLQAGCYAADHRTIHCINHDVEAAIVRRRGLWK